LKGPSTRIIIKVIPKPFVVQSENSNPRIPRASSRLIAERHSLLIVENERILTAA
jgi:hypothetical protein